MARLPVETRVLDIGSRMSTGMTDIGYRSSADVLLNLQCVKCGTWLGIEDEKLIDFEGGSHECAGEPFGKSNQRELDL